MKDDLPSLDVIVLCYNEESEIAGCLDALLVQRQLIRRIIVVDNNSTDQTRPIIERYQKQHPANVQYVLEESQGIVPARNRGFLESRADIMARIDADTRVSANWARELRKFYGNNPQAAAGSGPVEYYDLPARRISRFLAWLFMDIGNKISGNSTSLYGANMSIRRSVWEEIKGTVRMDANIMEDLSIGIALNDRGYQPLRTAGALALASGRRLRTSPRQFFRYNMQWPRTYRVYSRHIQAFITTIVATIGVMFQIVAGFFLQWHDPETGKFSVRKVSEYEERIIP